MESLNERREKLCLNFAQKCLKNPRNTHMFPENIKTHEMKTRKGNIFQVQNAVSERLKKITNNIFAKSFKFSRKDVRETRNQI